jgi:hypothetical protein
MARHLKIGARVIDKRQRFGSRLGKIVSVSGQGHSRKWNVLWDGGAMEQVAARSLQLEGGGASISTHTHAAASAASGAAELQSSDDEGDSAESSENSSEDEEDGSEEESSSGEDLAVDEEAQELAEEG